MGPELTRTAWTAWTAVHALAGVRWVRRIRRVAGGIHLLALAGWAVLGRHTRRCAILALRSVADRRELNLATRARV